MLKIREIHHLNQCLTSMHSMEATHIIQRARHILAPEGQILIQKAPYRSFRKSCQGSARGTSRAIELQQIRKVFVPSNAGHYNLSGVVNHVGRADDAIPLMKKAMRLSPICAQWYLGAFGQPYLLLNDGENAVAICLRAVERDFEGLNDHANLAIAYSMLGCTKDAQTTAIKLRSVNMQLLISRRDDGRPYQDQADIQWLASYLCLADLTG